MKPGTLILLFLLIVNSVFPDTIRHHVVLGYPEISLKDQYSEFTIPNGFHYSEPGKPDLPFVSLDFLMPPGHIIQEVRIIDEKNLPQFENMIPRPVCRQFPVSEQNSFKNKEINQPVPDLSIYKGLLPYPSSRIGLFTTQFLSGYAIGIVTLNPFTFHPETKSVTYCSEMVIEIITAEDAKSLAALKFLRNSPKINHRITEIVENDHEIIQFRSFLKNNPSLSDLLIIADESLIPHFDDFIRHKMKYGILCNVISTQTIDQTYQGTDLQEKIRNCIIDQYLTKGVSSVILAGDADAANPGQNLLPHRGLYVETYAGGEMDADIPADIYYACLDGTWNQDNDLLWGEPGEEDLFSEVTIGRICADNAEELTNQLEKIILFEQDPVINDLKKGLMLGEMLSTGTFGGNYKTEVAHGSDHGGYITAGFPTDFEITELYEMNTLWEKEEVLKYFNEYGAHWINHLGHADNTWCLKMPDHFLKPENITNNGQQKSFNIIYSQGCYNAAFDNRTASLTYVDDCFTEIAQALSTFQAAAIGNSRYGWYMTNSTAGASQYFDRQFFDAVFGENLKTIGEANADSKEDNAGYILNNKYVRWCNYSLNLFGDPTMKIYSDVPQKITCSHSPIISQTDTCIAVTSNAPGCSLAATQNDIFLGTTQTDSAGFAILTFNQPLPNSTPIHLYLSGQNKLTYHQTIQVCASGSCLNIDSIWFMREGTAQRDTLISGEEYVFNLRIKNEGSSQSNAGSLCFSSNSNSILFSDSCANFEMINPGEEITIANQIVGTISKNTGDLQSIEIIISVDDGVVWTYYTNPVVIKCIPEIEILQVNDPSANGNDIPDPGETSEIQLLISNKGHAATAEGFIKLTTSSELVSIFQDSDSVFKLQGQSDSIFKFQFFVDSMTPVSFPFAINVLWLSQNPDTLINQHLYFKTGSPAENFETGDFSKFPWITSGDQHWLIDSTEMTGDWSAKSGAIGHNQQSRLKIEIDVMQNYTISFNYKVSSEAGYDFLFFYDNGILKGRWAGESGWKNFSVAMSAGTHTLEWVYRKDVYFSQGSDCAWVDKIHFPMHPVKVVFAGADRISCNGNLVTPTPWINGIETFWWDTSGDGIFNDPSTLAPEYYPGENDLLNHEVFLVISGAYGNGDILKDTLSAKFLKTPEPPEKPSGSDSVCINFNPVSRYEIPGYDKTSSSVWKLEPPEAGSLFPSDSSVIINWNNFTGTANLSAKAINPCGESAFSPPMSINLKTCEIGVVEFKNHGITVFPNPANKTISITGIITIVKSVSIVDFQGKKGDLKLSDQSTTFVYDISEFKPGLYYVLIQTSDNMIIRKLIIF